MSIYATLWRLQFPRDGDPYVGCEWVEVSAQGVPAHIGTPTSGYGYESGDPYATFLPPALRIEEGGASEDDWRAVVFVRSGSTKGTARSGQEYESPLFVLTGNEYDAIPFQALHDRICAALRGTKPRLALQVLGPDARTTLVFERAPEGGPRWGETSNPEEDPPDCHDESRSYWLCFVSSADERLKFATDTVEPDEEGVERRFQGEGSLGYVVAVSLVAPFAAVTLDQMEIFENGSRSDPDVEPHIFGLDGRKVDPEDHYRELVDEAGFTVLKGLRAEIVRVLGRFAVAVIPEGDLERPVRWLRGSQDIIVGEPITVRDAFFFRSV